MKTRERGDRDGERGARVWLYTFPLFQDARETEQITTMIRTKHSSKLEQESCYLVFLSELAFQKIPSTAGSLVSGSQAFRIRRQDIAIKYSPASEFLHRFALKPLRPPSASFFPSINRPIRFDARRSGILSPLPPLPPPPPPRLPGGSG